MPFWEFTPQKFTSKVAINFSFLLTEILLIKIPYVDLTGNKELLQEKRRPKSRLIEPFSPATLQN